ncbi:MAG: hypothetical protein U5K71_15710 [Gracilimonas sp.]|nr:hypothetical protein [Gracilimonas sp.]
MARQHLRSYQLKSRKEIINLLPEKFPKAKIPKLYIRESIITHRSLEKLGKGYKLFAKTKDGLELLNPSQIYYSDKAKLPRKLFRVISNSNYPSRGGGQRAIEFFGINDLSDVEIQIKKVSKLEKLK